MWSMWDPMTSSSRGVDNMPSFTPSRRRRIGRLIAPQRLDHVHAGSPDSGHQERQKYSEEQNAGCCENGKHARQLNFCNVARCQSGESKANQSAKRYAKRRDEQPVSEHSNQDLPGLGTDRQSNAKLTDSAAH